VAQEAQGGGAAGAGGRHNREAWPLGGSDKGDKEEAQGEGNSQGKGVENRYNLERHG